MRRVTLISLVLLIMSSTAAIAAKTYTISGYVKSADGKAISAVTMSGLPGDPTTNNKGYYKAEVQRYWFGTVTPVKEGYSFSPASKSYSFIRSNKKQDYTGTLRFYTISGYVRTAVGKAISEVTMSGLPGNPETNRDGYYEARVDHGWDGKVTPEKKGYTFSPESKTYSDVGSDQKQNYTAGLLSYTITGYVRTSSGAGISGVQMSGLPGNPTTNNDGYYTASVVHGWDGKVTPEKTGYVFNPSYKSFSNVTKDQKQNFTGTQLTHTISGYVTTSGGKALKGVVMAGLPGNPETGSDGFYSAQVDHGWSGTVTPGKAGYAFNPSSKSFSNVTGNKSQNFSATLLSYSISGYVKTSGGKALEGVTLSGLPGNPSTNDDGYYSARVDHGWDGTVTPAKTGYYFTPASKTYSNVSSDQNQNFTAGLLSYTITGYVLTSEGEALQGVSMSGLPGNPASNKDGYYTAKVEYGWDGTVEPAKTGYAFSPVSKSYTDVGSNQSQDYTGTLLTYTISGHLLTSEGAAMEGVIMTGLPGNPATNSEGFYSVTVDHGWSGTVMPGEPGYAMDPESRKYSGVDKDMNDDYTATLVPFLLLSGSRLIYSPGAGGQQSIEVTSNIQWTATVDADWLEVSPDSGIGFVGMSISTIKDNEELISRTVDVVISGGGLSESIEIMQLGAQIKLEISKTIIELAPDSGATDVIDLTANIDWILQEDIDWLSVSPGSGNSNSQLVFTAESENTSFETRSGSLTIEGAGFIHTVLVSQEGIQPVLDLEQPLSNLAAEAGASLDFSISSNSPWTIETDAPWLSCSPCDGSGDAIITVLADSANTEVTPRQTTITITAGSIVKSFSISQEGINPNGIEASDLLQLTLFPNPAHDRIFLRSNEEFAPGAILEIYHLSGKLAHIQVLKGIHPGEGMEVDISAYAAGAYKMVIRLDGRTMVRTFMKDK